MTVYIIFHGDAFAWYFLFSFFQWWMNDYSYTDVMSRQDKKQKKQTLHIYYRIRSIVFTHYLFEVLSKDARMSFNVVTDDFEQVVFVRWERTVLGASHNVRLHIYHVRIVRNVGCYYSESNLSVLFPLSRRNS